MAQTEVSEKLSEALFQRTPDGRQRFSDEQIKDFLPLLLLQTGSEIPFEQWPPKALQLVQAFITRIKVNPTHTIEQALAQYLKTKPIPKELTETFKQVLLEHRTDAGTTAAEKFLQFVGDTMVPETEPSPNDTPAGPLAQFALRDKKL